MSKSNHKITHLMNDLILIRFIKKNTTIEEAREVLRWIEASDDNKAHFAKLHVMWAASEIYNDNTYDLDAIRTIMKKTEKGKTWRMFYKHVAAACVIAFIAAGLYQWNEASKTPDYEAAIKNISQGSDITLKISNTKEIQLTDSVPIVAYSRNRIIINDSIEVVEKKTGETLNTIHVPYGKRSKLILSDGTTVHLNSGSILVYPTEFGNKKREVYLDGEAYFEVTTNEKLPFIVQTLYRAVEVYGTQFNVSVDRKLQLFETTLVSGSVAIADKNKKEILTPNQYYSYSNIAQTEEIKEVNVDNYILWKDGKLQFEKEALYIAIRKLEKIYNIRIELSDNKYLNYNVSGLLNLKDSANETVINILSTISPERLMEDQGFFTIYNNK